MDCIRVCSLNANGLRNKFKRRSIFRILKQKQYDVICLQETNITDNIKDVWGMEWGGQFFYSPGTNHSLGQVSLIKKDFAYDFIVTYKSDRILTVSCETENGTVHFVNIYAPNISSEKTDFFRALTDHLDQLDGEKIVCGDFNCVLDNKLDITSGNIHKVSDVMMFQNLTVNIGLNDVWRLFHPDEKEYSWSRKNPFTARRLDYILVSDNIYDKIIDCNIISAPHSDHRIVDMKYKVTHTQRGPSYWKFNDSLLRDLDFANMTNSVIDQFKVDNINVEPQLKWDLCKIEIREHCIAYATTKKRNQVNHFNILQTQCDSVDRLLSSDPSNDQLQAERERIKKELDIYAISEARSAQIRSRTKFIEEGEKNTKYFLNLEKARANAKIMDRLKTDNGLTISNQEGILKEQVKFYSNVYSKKRDFDEQRSKDFMCGTNIPTLSEEQKTDLDTNITLNELTKTLSTMKNNSAPGPDGLTASFLKFFWIKIGSLVIDSFNAAYNTGEMSTTQKQAVITLIHKGKGLPRDELANWRPISLTNADYKLLAKCLASRLSSILPDIVHENQTGFVKGRKASNMIRLIDDTIEYMKTSDKPGIMLAIDYSRAFDSISKDFMIWAFKQFGFGDHFVHWIEVLTNNTESSINYLGWISESFSVHSGLRQGCPFSPIGFIIALEMLAIKIRADNTLKGLDFPTSLSAVNPANVLIILMYADDITLFLKDTHDLERVLQLMDVFSTLSNLEINKNKTEAMWLGSNRNSNDSPMNLVWKNKIKILGIFFCNTIPASSLEENWTKRLHTIQGLIASWSKRNLSISGKLCIIKTFLLSQLVYVMQALIIPVDILKQINTMLFRFLWKRKCTNNRAFEKVKRSVICNNNENGGLNMIDVITMQTSFVLSWAVELQHSINRHLWQEIPNYLFSKLGVNLSCFLSDVPANKFIGSEQIQSVFWKEVLITWLNNKRKLNLYTKQCNSYTNFSLWNNDCICYRNRCLFFKDWVEANIYFVADIVKGGEFISFERLCDRIGPKPTRLFEYNAICTALRSRAASNLMMHVSTENNISPSLSTLPTARNLRLLLTEASVTQPCSVNFWLRKYDLSLTKVHWTIAKESTKEERLRLLHWKILHNIYPTNILLHKMGLRDNKNCKYCDETDYIEHFFWHCVKVRKVWTHCMNHIFSVTSRSVTLSENEVLLGFITPGPKSFNRFVNHIILITKMVISKYKYGTETDMCVLFDLEVNVRKKFLEYMY